MHTLCTAAIGSLTHAMKGQRLLDDLGIAAKIVKLDAGRTKKGCSYGIEFACSELKRARAALGAAHLPISAYLDGGGGELL